MDLAPDRHLCGSLLRVQARMSRAPKQLSAEQIAERAERVYAIESVTALAQAPEQALRYYTQLTDVAP